MVKSCSRTAQTKIQETAVILGNLFRLSLEAAKRCWNKQESEPQMLRRLGSIWHGRPRTPKPYPVIMAKRHLQLAGCRCVNISRSTKPQALQWWMLARGSKHGCLYLCFLRRFVDADSINGFGKSCAERRQLAK